MLDLLKIFASEFVFTLIVPGIFLGIILLLVGRFIPSVFAQYKLPATLSGLALVFFFVYQSGRYAEHSKYKVQMLEQQAEIAILKAKSATITTEIVTEFVDRIKYVEVIKKVPIDVYISQQDNQRCVISDSTASNIRMLINTSNQGLLPDTAIRINEGSEPTR